MPQIRETTPEDHRTPSAALQRLHREDEGLATAEYGIVMLAAVAFAGLLTAVLSSETVRGWLEALVQQALNAG